MFVSLRREDCRGGVVITELKFPEQVTEEGPSKKSRNRTKKESYSAIPVEFATVIFLPLSALADFPQKGKYRRFFDMMFISDSMARHIDKSLIGMTRQGGVVIVETPLYHLETSKEEVQAACEGLRARLQDCGCCPYGEFHQLKDSTMGFTVQD